MTKRNQIRQQTLPALYPQLYLALAQERGASRSRLISAANLSPDVLENPRATIPLPQMGLLLRAIMAEVGDDGIAIEVGLRLAPTAFGNLGYALLCSETLADAINLCERYWHMLGGASDITLQRGDHECVVYLTQNTVLPDALKHISYQATLASLYRGFQLLTQADATQMEIWFTSPAPVYADKVTRLLGHVRYGMPANQFRFAASLLSRKLPMHNAHSLRQALAACEREQALSNIGHSHLRDKVRQEILFGQNGYPSLNQVCSNLNMTARTLRRKLEDEGTNFKLLLEEAKRRDALKLLDDQHMEIQRIATILGYQDPANFTRAFRQWTGQTPSQYRQLRNH